MAPDSWRFYCGGYLNATQSLVYLRLYVLDLDSCPPLTLPSPLVVVSFVFSTGFLRSRIRWSPVLGSCTISNRTPRVLFL